MIKLRDKKFKIMDYTKGKILIPISLDRKDDDKLTRLIKKHHPETYKAYQVADFTNGFVIHDMFVLFPIRTKAQNTIDPFMVSAGLLKLRKSLIKNIAIPVIKLHKKYGHTNFINKIDELFKFEPMNIELFWV